MISLPFNEYRANNWRNSNMLSSSVPGNGGIRDKLDAVSMADGVGQECLTAPVVTLPGTAVVHRRSDMLLL